MQYPCHFRLTKSICPLHGIRGSCPALNEIRGKGVCIPRGSSPAPSPCFSIPAENQTDTHFHNHFAPHFAPFAFPSQNRSDAGRAPASFSLVWNIKVPFLNYFPPKLSFPFRRSFFKMNNSKSHANNKRGLPAFGFSPNSATFLTKLSAPCLWFQEILERKIRYDPHEKRQNGRKEPP